MTSEKENRRSFRILESMHLSYEVISDREFHDGLDNRKLRPGANDGLRSRILDIDARIVESLFALRSESGLTADCIALLNEKLSVIMDQLPEMRQVKSSLAQTKPQVCELGADGMLFGTQDDLAPGTRLALRFLLRSHNRYVETFCEVKRQGNPPENDGQRYRFGIAVAFEGMPLSQREILIQHLFSRETEALRMRKREMESAANSAATD
ncbi:MAG: hypothetical protein WD672_04115 [Woeseia sp.]